MKVWVGQFFPLHIYKHLIFSDCIGATAEDDGSDVESVHDYDVNSEHSSANNLQNTDRLPVEILEAIKSLGMVEKLWQKAQPLAENVADILKLNEIGLVKK